MFLLLPLVWSWGYNVEQLCFFLALFFIVSAFFEGHIWVLDARMFDCVLTKFVFAQSVDMFPFSPLTFLPFTI